MILLDDEHLSRLPFRNQMIPIHWEGEVWKEITQDIIPDISPMYAVSNYGRVVNYMTGFMIRAYDCNGEYQRVTLYLEGNRKTRVFSVHRLVVSVFDNIPYTNPGLVVNHLDGDPSNNRYGNLELTTYSGNSQHAYDIGLHKKYYGEDHPNSTYTNEQVHLVCKMLEDRASYDDIARALGKEPGKNINGFISMIRRGESWPHISCQYTFPEVNNNKQSFTNDQVHKICKLYADGEQSSRTILSKIGYNLEELDEKEILRLMSVIRDIRRKRGYTKISDLYF